MFINCRIVIIGMIWIAVLFQQGDYGLNITCWKERLSLKETGTMVVPCLLIPVGKVGCCGVKPDFYNSVSL